MGPSGHRDTIIGTTRFFFHSLFLARIFIGSCAVDENADSHNERPEKSDTKLWGEEEKKDESLDHWMESNNV